LQRVRQPRRHPQRDQNHQHDAPRDHAEGRPVDVVHSPENALLRHRNRQQPIRLVLAQERLIRAEEQLAVHRKRVANQRIGQMPFRGYLLGERAYPRVIHLLDRQRVAPAAIPGVRGQRHVNGRAGMRDDAPRTVVAQFEQKRKRILPHPEPLQITAQRDQVKIRREHAEKFTIFSVHRRRPRETRNVETAAGAQEAGGESHADSFMISRRNGNPANVVSRASADNRALWNLRNRVSRMSNGERYIGRLSLFNQQADTGANPDGPEQPDMGLGASTPDGSLLAFNLAGSYLGNGLMVAAAAPSAPLPEQASYRVQGVIVGLADEENQLDHLSGGTLTIRGSDAQLESDLVEVSHRPATDELGLPARTRPASGTSRAPDLTGHYTLNANPDGRLLLSASGYSLEGFYTGQGDQIFLVLKDGQPANPRTGLIMATRIPDTRG